MLQSLSLLRTENEKLIEHHPDLQDVLEKYDFEPCAKRYPLNISGSGVIGASMSNQRN